MFALFFLLREVCQTGSIWARLSNLLVWDLGPGWLKQWECAGLRAEFSFELERAVTKEKEFYSEGSFLGTQFESSSESVQC